jgi:nucleoside-diphosphate-sugar epimerase
MPVLAHAGFEARGLSRANAPDLADASADWTSAVSGADAVVHLAAMVHRMGDTSGLAAAFEQVNSRGPALLAAQAWAAGVRRFIYFSSVKVHGESGRFSEESPRRPMDPYGRSKCDGEDRLREVAERTGLELVIVRPPLVYGPGVGANFAALLSAVRRGVPLPLGGVHNARSLVGVENLADFVCTVLRAPAAPGEAFLVSDGSDLSTPDLIRALARAAGRPARLVTVPPGLLRLAASAFGRRQAAERLLGSLTVDISKAERLLGWTPPHDVDGQLSRSVTR